MMFCTTSMIMPSMKRSMPKMERTSYGDNKWCNMNLDPFSEVFGQDKVPIPRNWCILDSQSTCDCFCSKKYLKNIRQIDHSVVIRCNGGIRETNWIGDLPGYPQPVWFDAGGIANIISLKNCESFLR